MKGRIEVRRRVRSRERFQGGEASFVWDGVRVRGRRRERRVVGGEFELLEGGKRCEGGRGRSWEVRRRKGSKMLIGRSEEGFDGRRRGGTRGGRRRRRVDWGFAEEGIADG